MPDAFKPWITEPGIYDMPAEAYHRDPVAVAPSLSASLARIITMQSPLHAWHAHPRLNPEWMPDEPNQAQLEGQALHALILDQDDQLDALPYKTWQSNDAKAAKAASLAAGRVPVTMARALELRRAARAVRRQLDAHAEDSDAFTNGVAERVLVWIEETQYGPIWCRSRVDWLGRCMDDLKSTDAKNGAHPEEWSRGQTREGRWVQGPFYMRGARALRLTPAGFRWIVFERTAPHALSTISMEPELEDYAEKQAEAAIQLWAEAMKTGKWPGYLPRRWYAELPNYLSEKHAARVATAARMKKYDRGNEVANRSMPFA